MPQARKFENNCPTGLFVAKCVVFSSLFWGIKKTKTNLYPIKKVKTKIQGLGDLYKGVYVNIYTSRLKPLTHCPFFSESVPNDITSFEDVENYYILFFVFISSRRKKKKKRTEIFLYTK